MSTRCKIDFQQDGEVRSIYRHSDGYPDDDGGVVADLRAFRKWNAGRNDDLEYAVANFVWWAKTRMVDGPVDLTDPPNPLSDMLLGYGICDPDCHHDDLDWYYQVNLVEGRVVAHPVKRDDDKGDNQLFADCLGTPRIYELEGPPCDNES